MSFTNGEVMNVAALGLVVGTLFFTTFGINTERDFFLLLGLCTTTVGNLCFAAFLWGEAPEKNNEHAVFYCCLAALSAFGVYAQFQKYREVRDDRDHELNVHIHIRLLSYLTPYPPLPFSLFRRAAVMMTMKYFMQQMKKQTWL
jgi:hypothetical protein